MVKLCEAPVAAVQFVPAPTDACTVQVPAPTKLTTPELTVHVPEVNDAVDNVPSEFVVYVGVKLPPNTATPTPGMLLIETEPAALLTACESAVLALALHVTPPAVAPP